MTNTETKFRNNMKRKYPGAYIKKIPDFKQAGMSAAKGLPDYLVIRNGITEWYEVKSGFGDTLSLRHFTSAQKIEFTKMLHAGCNVRIYGFSQSKGIYNVFWSYLLEYKFYKLK